MKMSLLIILLIIFLWGLWGFFSKLAVGKLGIQASFWETLAALLAICAFLIIIAPSALPLKFNSSGIILAVIGGAASGVATVLFFKLLKIHPAGYLIAITALYPLVTLILSIIFLKESLTLTRAIGFILALAALVLLNL